MNNLEQDLDEFISLKEAVVTVRMETSAFSDLKETRTIGEITDDSPAYKKLISFLNDKSDKRLSELVTVGDGGRDLMMDSRIPEQDLDVESYYNEYQEEERPLIVQTEPEFNFEEDFKQFENQIREASFVYLVEKPLEYFYKGRQIYNLY